ncbi:MAG TPA: hypothetical protein VIY90_17575 [Steroidobacteraceae bacterium]
MNETEFIRQQLAAERAHLREILLVVRQGTDPAKMARPVAAYVEWASQRLLQQLSAHRSALQAVPTIAAATRAQLTDVSSIATHAVEAPAARSRRVQAQRLLALLEAWSDSLDAVAGATLRIGHWRQVAHLSADTILEERQLYAAARAAAGLT